MIELGIRTRMSILMSLLGTLLGTATSSSQRAQRATVRISHQTLTMLENGLNCLKGVNLFCSSVGRSCIFCNRSLISDVDVALNVSVHVRVWCDGLAINFALEMCCSGDVFFRIRDWKFGDGMLWRCFLWRCAALKAAIVADNVSEGDAFPNEQLSDVSKYSPVGIAASLSEMQ